VKLKNAFLLIAACLLLVAIALVIYGSTTIPAPRFTGRVADLLPPAPSGWALKEKPIADSEELKQAVGELLNYDDGVFVDYTNAVGDRLSVYIAYWTPGKMSHRLVAGHTPDVCWVGAGWQKIQQSRMEEFRMQVSKKLIPAGESRTFTANSKPEYVWYWHLVGETSVSYGTGKQPPWYAAISDVFKKGLNQREEQFFIRLSSDRPLPSFMNGEVLPTLLDQIPWPETPITP
jgi:hypothetical protein